MHNRRYGHPDFASRWDIALVGAHARYHAAGGRWGPERVRPEGRDGALRTVGGELTVARTRSGRLQVRPAHPNKLTKAAEQLFLQALSATANIRLSAAAVGASAGAFYRRRRQNRPFAREERLALETGYDRLKWAVLAAGRPESHMDDAWRHNESPPIPPLSANQAFQLLYLHQKSVELSWGQAHRRRRRGESDEIHRERLRAMWVNEQARAAEMEAVRRSIELDSGEPPPPLPPLPALDQVTGWSRASGRAPHHEGVAVFGGWRIADMERKRRKRRGEGGEAPGGIRGKSA
jgi:hypothetical protein